MMWLRIRRSVSRRTASWAFVADFTRGAAGTARELKFDVPLLDYDTSVYSAKTPDAKEAVQVVRTAKSRKGSGANSVTFTGKTLAASAYV